MAENIVKHRQMALLWFFVIFQITAAAFGGPNLDELYVTSAQLVVKGVEQPAPAGAVFKVTGTGAKGLPGYKVDLNKLK